METRQCPECNEELAVDSMYKDQLVYICPNMHRSVFLDEAA